MDELNQTEIQDTDVEYARNRNQLDPADDVGVGVADSTQTRGADLTKASKKVEEPDDPFFRAFLQVYRLA